MPHYEQVYKVYCIKAWYSTEIRLSLPEKLVLGKDSYAFDSQKPFDAKDFTEFSKDVNRLDKKLTNAFVKNFAEHFNMNFYGIDIIVDKSTGKHYVVDCNYLPNYSKISL